MTDKDCDIEKVTDELLKVLERAISQSKNTTLKSKKKIVSTEYDEELKKPMCETTEECEEITKLKGTVDVNSLKILTGLLKEISDMKEAFSAPDEEKGQGVLPQPAGNAAFKGGFGVVKHTGSGGAYLRRFVAVTLCGCKQGRAYIIKLNGA